MWFEISRYEVRVHSTNLWCSDVKKGYAFVEKSVIQSRTTTISIEERQNPTTQV